MAVYEYMKNSKVTWLGSIPENWALTTISAIYNLRNEKVSDKDYPPLSVTMKGVVPQLKSAAKTENGDNRKLAKKGDFVINSRSDRRGSCGISNYDGSVSLINTVITPKGKMHPGYYDWLFHTVAFADEFYKWGHGIVNDLWTTHWQEMKRIIIPVPPFETQVSIATYLNDQCAKIDTLISEAKTSIEEYKQWKASLIYEAVTKGLDPNVEMKDSGVEWIGKIPTRWTIGKIKHFAELMPKCDFSALDSDDEITFTPMDCIKNGYFENQKELYKDINGSYTQYAEGDIVLAKVTPCFENGNAAIMKNLHSGLGLGSSELFVLRTHDIIREFLFLFIRNPQFIQAGCATMTGTGGLKRVSSNFIKNCPITIPDTFEEQTEIVNYINKQFKNIDLIISEKQAVIVELENYKKSLIFETVTGKRKVV